jgi:hypothetical protein
MIAASTARSSALRGPALWTYWRCGSNLLKDLPQPGGYETLR